MTWKCENCGETISKEKLEEIIKSELSKGDVLSEEMGISDVNEVLLVDCRSCDEELATYKKDTTDPSGSDKTNARSSMLEAARQRA